MRLTRNFTAEEFGNPPEQYHPAMMELARKLQIVRDTIGKPIIITSGWRSRYHNKEIGGSPTSDHMRCLAADYYVQGMFAEILALATRAALKAKDETWDQIIWYQNDGHVHLGIGFKMRNEYWKQS